MVEQTVDYLKGELGPEAWHEGMHPEIPETRVLDNPYTYTYTEELRHGVTRGGDARPRLGSRTMRAAVLHRHGQPPEYGPHPGAAAGPARR